MEKFINALSRFDDKSANVKIKKKRGRKPKMLKE